MEAEKAKLESEKLALKKQKATKSAIADINITREKIEATKEADKTYKEAVVKVDQEKDLSPLKEEKKQETTKSEIADINITREEMEATKEADKIYEEAIMEMDKED